MDLNGISAALLQDPGVAEVLELVPARGALDIVAPSGVRAPLIAEIAQQRPVVVVTSTGRAADELAAALHAYLPEEQADSVAVFPAWETLPHERLSPRADTVGRRLAVLRRLAHPEPDSPLTGPIRILVVPTRALLQPVIKGLGDIPPIELQVGDIADLTEVAEKLVAAAYTRVDMVERRGEFAVRGGILDVFSPIESHPLRIDFFGDEVSEIRWFSVSDQRSLEIAPHGLWAPPCRELLLTDAVRQRAAALIPQLPAATDMLVKIADGIPVEGMESLTPALVPGLQPLLDLVSPDSVLVIDEYEKVRRRAHDLVATTAEFLDAAWSGAVSGGKVPLNLSAASFATLEETRDLAERRELGWWAIGAFGIGGDGEPDSVIPGDGAQTAIIIDAREIPSYRGDVERALREVRAMIRDGWRIVLATTGLGSAKRMVDQLGLVDCPARLVTALPPPIEPNLVWVVPAAATRGFVAPELKFAVFTEVDITGRAGPNTKDMRKLPSRRRNVVDPLQLRAGDYVVHETHGVGKFLEMAQRTLGTGPNAHTKEFLLIEYAPSKRGHPGDRLFVPMEQLDQVTKYVGGEAPSLSRMGGADWKNTKSKARAHVRQIAGELIRLYSARSATKGFAYGPDTPWQRELEDAFDYVETPDQLVTIDEVKADMEKATPMDRLICGDVGYGKTEIAIRAAFKAVQDGKQVAILVPTTLLVQQHFETFSERYSGFPIKVAALSRFQTDKQAEEVIKGLADGTIDVVIGTHRLLTGTVRFKDLGLVVIDEEQRFGVEHKETLKQLRTNVDVLAMSATPIPRTLEMAVTGIREMSILQTPPEERHPVLTYVGAWEQKQIVAAIRRELLRDGQVFYVHNRVESIERTAARLREWVPEARIAVAHGRMSEVQLDKVIRDFWEREIDVLVCTTIIETGLDISNANTLIVERADAFGLSQLHQLRGRVGRGRERAYAYFLYPAEKPLTETAHDRLATMSAHTDLGAGMQIAMKDLEIRGAGNLLGGEQSGHIAGVGFDLYVRMVGEAVAAFKGETSADVPEVSVELPVDAHLPEKYISTERLRLEAYKKIAAASTDT
ncbi:MAG: transcription-repair coupling factor, partial [Promicromonosporaceae bacterium]|nr:transcription-repair coupling factor [Promicromonosporaceae bacterium]